MEALSKALAEAPTSEELYDILSQYESEACLLFTDKEVTGDPESLSTFYASYFISLLLIDQIFEARMLTSRMPPTMRKDDLALQNCQMLLRALWQYQYPAVYRILRELPWPDPLKGVVQKYDAYFVDKTFKDISRTYEAIRPEVAAEYLGLEYATKGALGENANEHIPALIESLTERGWNWDADGGVLRPKVPPNQQEITQPTATAMSDLLSLTDNLS